MTLESRIRAQAAELGFVACGFAAVEPLPRGAFLGGWLDAGHAGEMRYLERRPTRRLGVALAGARTIISLAYPYAPPPAPRMDLRAELRGRIAAYALGEDYHRVIERGLRYLAAFVRAESPGAATRRWVDTAAVLEREWAQRAGLGWFGKSTMLLSTRAGSWFFLAELATTVALAPDPPATEHCGTCNACRDLCPTGALRDGLVIDARRCISYLTIEHRSAIPHELRPHLGSWVFGCDVCQQVCPWNDAEHRARGAHLALRAPWLHAEAAPPGDGAHEVLYPFLPALLALDEAGFATRFGRTPVARARRCGLLRNAAVALGNSGNPDAVPSLASALDDPEPLIRGHAAWALGRLRTPAARRALDTHARREPDLGVAAEITLARAQG